MEYEKKNKDAISTIKQAIRQLSTNGVPVGNIIKAIKDIEEKYAESDDERIRGNIIATIHLYYGEPLEDEAKEMIAWLEKQGEQKIKTPEESMGIDSDTYNKIVDECIYGEQKPIDKVEPKFKVGDWVVYCNDDVDLITGIEENGYCVNNSGYIPFICESDIRLWTVQDAKDGDVLFTSSTASHETFIFKNIDEKGNAKCYFAYDSEDGFREGKYHFIGRVTKCKPATKEQRDTLIKAMADAGYTFDFEKKELKEIDTAEWSEECCINQLIVFCENCMVQDSNAKKCASFLKSLKERYTWKPSEEQIEALKQAKTDAFGKPYFNALASLYINLKGY